jgi:acetyl-CoA carboxylase carboxyl transferase subunit beta
VKEIFRRRPKYVSLPHRTNDASHRVPDNVWISCPHCHELLYTKEYEDNFKVCSKCRYHARLSPHERLTTLLDDGSFEELDAGLCSADPLRFSVGDQSYVDKLEECARRAGTREAVMYGTGTIAGQPIVVAVHNPHFIAGSMGVAVGEKVARAIERAADQGLPLVIVAASGGARMQEGVHGLMQMAKTVAALDRFKGRRLPYLAILTDPTVGGVLASYVFRADVTMAEPGAFISFAGPRVIEQAAKKKLPDDVNTAEFMLAHGMIDLVVPRAELRSSVATLLRLLTARTYRPDAGHAAVQLAASGQRGNGRHG